MDDIPFSASTFSIYLASRQNSLGHCSQNTQCSDRHTTSWCSRGPRGVPLPGVRNPQPGNRGPGTRGGHRGTGGSGVRGATAWRVQLQVYRVQRDLGPRVQVHLA